MAGSWSGVGSLTMTNGAQEPLRCRANYHVGGNGSEMQLSLRCASDSYNFNLGGDVQSDGRAVSGSWSEATRNASGTVSGRVSGDRIQVVARGDSFSASLSLVTARQSTIGRDPAAGNGSQRGVDHARQGQPTTTARLVDRKVAVSRVPKFANTIAVTSDANFGIGTLASI